MTINEVIYTIREEVRQYSDDSSISNRFILFEVDLARAAYLQSVLDSNRNMDVNDDWKQIICIELEEIPNSQCGCVDEECTIMRSTKTIPNLVGGGAKVASGKYDAIPFDTISWNKFPFSGSGQYNKDIVFASVRSDNYVYIKSKNNLHKLIECAYVTGLFENPEDATDFTDGGEPCFDKATSQYPLDAAAFNTIKERVVRTLLRHLRIKEDTLNNAKDDVQG